MKTDCIHCQFADDCDARDDLCDMFWNELNTASEQILQTFRKNQTKSKIIDFQQVQSREFKVKRL